MADFSEQYLEMAEKIQREAVEAKIEASRIKQCDLYEFREWDKLHCFECGDEVPGPRREMGCVKCVYCQEAAEKFERRKHGR